MKVYKLEIYRSTHTEEVEVKAEAHTFDNNMILFWTRNSAQEWAMVCAYPTALTAIVYYDEESKPQLSGQAIVSPAPNIAEMMEVIGKTVKETPVKKARKK